jgi:hypothetical protein
VLFAKRAVATNGWVAGSHAASAEQWLADISGTTEFQARDALKTAERLEDLPATEAKLRDGSLLRALEPLAKTGFDEARKAEHHEHYDAYRFDALVALARTGGTTTEATPVARVRVLGGRDRRTRPTLQGPRL